MTRVTKGFLVLAAVLLLVLAAFLFSLWRSVPPLSGTEHVPGLTGEVTVTFDSLAIPRIQAASDEDAFTALGWLHARERLFAMEMMRRAAEGRLSEILGASTVETDKYLRSLDIRRGAERALASMPPRTRAILDAYVRGVNAWIAGHARPLPPEFRVLRITPEPYTAVQCFELAGLMAWDLQSGNVELRFARAAAKVGPERVRELFQPEDTSAVIVARWPTGPVARLSEAEIPRVPELAEQILDWASMARASNSWVIAGSRTASGKPIVANDPHLELRAPSLWYLATIASPGFNASGATLPGVPGVILGHNSRIAWGWTNGTIDDVDYVIERFSADTSRVLTTNGWQPVDVVRDSIRVHGGVAVPFVLRRTAHGPIVAASPDGGAPVNGEIRLLALRWNFHDAGESLTSILALDQAASWTDFLAAARGLKSPEQNWIYGDVDGNIGYTLTGAIPVRRSGNGLLPTPGWTDEGHWDRYLDFDELPRIYNPVDGYIVTANNRIAGVSYPKFLSADWELPYRAQRIREMITTHNAPLTTHDVQSMQMDTLDVFARWAKDLAARAAEAAGHAGLADTLRRWDGTMGADRLEPTIFWLWYRRLQFLTFDDELGGTVAPSGALQAWMRAGASPWFDDVRTPQVEDLGTLSLAAMRFAIAEARGRAWGDVHRTIARHPLGTVAPLDVLLRLNQGPTPKGGSLYTVNVGDFGAWTPPFTNTHGPSFRQVVNLATPEEAWTIISSGQSGNPLSRHYRDQRGAWLSGRFALVSLMHSEGTVLKLQR